MNSSVPPSVRAAELWSSKLEFGNGSPDQESGFPSGLWGLDLHRACGCAVLTPTLGLASPVAYGRPS